MPRCEGCNNPKDFGERGLATHRASCQGLKESRKRDFNQLQMSGDAAKGFRALIQSAARKKPRRSGRESSVCGHLISASHN